MFIFLFPHQLAEFKRLRITMPTVAELEDPFVLNRRVDHEQPDEVPLSDAEFEAALKPVYEQLEPHLKSMVSWEYYLQQAKDNREKFEPMLRTQQNHSDSTVSLANPQDYKQIHCLRLFPEIGSVGVWRHVGLEGIAIELDTDSEFFQASHFDGKPQLLKPVTYDDLRPQPPTSADPFPAAFKAPQHLAFDQEWRLLRPSVKQGSVPIPKELIKGIYLGVHCSGEVTQSLIELVKRDLQFRRIPLWQMAVSETHLRLNPVSLAGYVT